MRRIFLMFLFLLFIPTAFADDVFDADITGGCTTDILGFMENVSIEPVFAPKSIQCSVGQYLPVNTANCESCPAESTCTAGTYLFNETKSQGIVYNEYFAQNKPKGCAENILGIAPTVSFEPVFAPMNIQCAPGYYLEANDVSCTQCVSSDYCPGGTYAFNETNDQGSFACPAGYDYNTALGKSSITQCQIHCEGGTYVGTPAGYTRLEYVENSANTYVGTDVIPNVDDVEINVRFYKSGSGGSNYILLSRETSSGTIYGISGSATGSKIAASWGGSNVVSSITRQDGHIYNINAKFVNGVATLYVRDETTGNEATNTGTYTFEVPTSPFGIFGNYGGNRIGAGQRVFSAWIKVSGAYVMNYLPASYSGTPGFYDMYSKTFKGATVGTLIAGGDTEAFTGRCGDVGAGYWAAAGATNFGSIGTRNACPAGLTTAGYGHGADSANDCARTLRVGDKVLYGRRDKVTNPSLNIKLPNEDVYYVSLSPNNHNFSRLHLSFNGNEYTAYDDSLFHGERNFDTGQQIITP